MRIALGYLRTRLGARVLYGKVGNRLGSIGRNVAVSLSGMMVGLPIASVGCSVSSKVGSTVGATLVLGSRVVGSTEG